MDSPFCLNNKVLNLIQNYTIRTIIKYCSREKKRVVTKKMELQPTRTMSSKKLILNFKVIGKLQIRESSPITVLMKNLNLVLDTLLVKI